MFAGILAQIGMNLRSLGPLRIGVRHRLVRIAIEILGALGLHVRIGSCRLPDPAEIAAAFEDGHLMSAGAESLGCDEPGDACSNHTHILLLDHGRPPGSTW